MENYTYQTFKVDGQLFSVKTYPNGRTYVESIHPYDETEYHWARHKGREKDYWTIAAERRTHDRADGAGISELRCHF